MNASLNHLLSTDWTIHIAPILDADVRRVLDADTHLYGVKPTCNDDRPYFSFDIYGFLDDDVAGGNPVNMWDLAVEAAMALDRALANRNLDYTGNVWTKGRWTDAWPS